jgi:hypothetical protein
MLPTLTEGPTFQRLTYIPCNIWHTFPATPATFVQLDASGKYLLATVEDKFLPMAQSQMVDLGFIFTDISGAKSKRERD